MEEVSACEHVKCAGIQAFAGIFGLLRMFVGDLCAVCLAGADGGAIFCGGCLHG